MLKRNLLLTILSLLVTPILFAQVTTSSITGIVKDEKGSALGGATITAIHTESGTKYTTVTSKDGVFNLPAVRVGGPYQVTVSFVGLKPAIFENITVQLGEAYNINEIGRSTRLNSSHG
jgi:hypothetical protein